MSDQPYNPVRDEYIALRATIRERGSLRVIIFVLTFGAWGALWLAGGHLLGTPLSSLVPLLVLAAGFEAVASLHLGVERIGRYLQVRIEGDLPGQDAPLRTWERTAMAWGQRYPGSGTDPLFATYFFFALLLNVVPVILTALSLEIGAVALGHAAFGWRMWQLRAWSRRQRGEDLSRFQQLLAVREDSKRV